MEKVIFNDYLNEFSKQLPRGAFLTVKNDEEVNTMTIGWALAGRMWNKPMLMVAVRYSRHTYKLLENSEEFTVSVPKEGNLKDELAFCGTKSGRDFNKFKECNLTPVFMDNVKTPIIKECQLHYVCKKVYQQSMEPSLIKNNSVSSHYSDNDYHVLYFGEITETYKK